MAPRSPSLGSLSSSSTIIIRLQVVALFCIWSSNEAQAFQPHLGLTRSSSLFSFGSSSCSSSGSSGSNGNGGPTARLPTSVRSSRGRGPLSPLSSPTISVGADYSRFKNEEWDDQWGRTTQEAADNNDGDASDATAATVRMTSWVIPAMQDEFDEFREKYSQPGALLLTTTTTSSSTPTTTPQQTQTYEQEQKLDLPSKQQQQQQQQQLTTKNHSSSSYIAMGCALAANSGFLNGVGLTGIIGKVQGVSAVTGTFTNSAVAASAIGTGAMAAVLLTPLCYMLGSFTNGLWNPNGIVLDEPNDYASSLRAGPLLVAGSMVLLATLLLSSSTARWNIHPNYIFSCLTFAMGLQNSWTSMLLKGNLLRTAHFSGITSDFGTFLGQTLRGQTEHAWKLPIFAKLATSFWVGGLASAIGTFHFGLSASTCGWMSTALYFGLWSHFSKVPRKVVSQFLVALQQRQRRLLPSSSSSKLSKSLLQHQMGTAS